MQKITPMLWFDKKAEEAAKFYVSVFPNSKITSVNPMVTTFELGDQAFIGLNGGLMYKFTEAISFVIDCADQSEVDYFWEKLSAVPEAEKCGWCKDKYGLSWQVIPKRLIELLNDNDTVKADYANNAMLKMRKIIITNLEEAHNGESI